MHEYSIARSLMKQVTMIARREGADRVTAVAVSVGEFSGVDPDLLRSAVEQLGATGMTQAAAWTIRPVPLTARCGACAAEFAVTRFRFVCPSCASSETRIVTGEELVLESVTLETGAEEPGVEEPGARNGVDGVERRTSGVGAGARSASPRGGSS